MKLSLGATALATTLLALSPQLTQAQSAIIGYNEVNGNHVDGWGSSGNLTGGPFDGKNISEITADQWLGAQNGLFALVGDDGLVSHYNILGINNLFFGTGLTSTLPGGDYLTGLPIKNDYWLGTTNTVNYYYHPDGGLVRYYNYGTHALNFDFSWTTFTNGELNGVSPSPGLGLTDFGGGNAMNENLFVIVGSNGTMEYYNLDNGFYSSGESEFNYGTWTTFSGGLLDGLTLSQLDANPTGVHNGHAYRFLGTADEGMFFEVSIVPEPSTALLALGSVMFAVRRRRSHR